MDWISYPANRPNGSGTYHVSINKFFGDKDVTFHYVAYYNAETNRWHKNDGFDDDSVKEVITERIVGWVDNLGILI